MRRLSVHLDPVTGVEVARLTMAPAVHHHLYLTTPTCTADGKLAVYISYETGSPNLCCVDIASGAVSRLTYRKDLNPFSCVITADNLAVLYTARDAIRATQLPEGQESVLARFPGARLGSLSLTPDGRYVAVTVSNGIKRQLTEVDLHTGNPRVVLALPWAIGRAQYDPAGERLLFAGEDASRIHVVNRSGTEERLLYPQVSGEWIMHETWITPTEIAFVKHHDGLYVIDLHGKVRAVFKGPIWHVAARRDGRLLVCDTHIPDIGLVVVSPLTGTWRVLCYPRSSNKGTQWFEPLPAAGAEDDPAEPDRPDLPFTDRETAYGPPWTHPHPSFHPDGQQVFFTSDASGNPQVCCVRIPREWLADLDAG